MHTTPVHLPAEGVVSWSWLPPCSKRCRAGRPVPRTWDSRQAGRRKT